MATKGSRKNPYTWSEYNYKLSNNTWYGGWVINGDNLVYHTQGIMTYSGPCSKSNPVPSDIYAEMAQTGIWLGGWVLFLTNTSEKRYVSSDGTEYDITIGSQSDPCPISIYDEMSSNGIWEGGWVEDSDGTIRYIQVFQISLSSGSGCGCGCGSGCGCGGSGSGDGGSGSGDGGCGSGSGDDGGCLPNYSHVFSGSCKAGDVYVVLGLKAFRAEVHVSWTGGNTVEVGLAIISTSIQITDSSITLLYNDLCASWSGPYQMSISGSFTIQYNQNNYRYMLNGGIFTVPAEYRY